MKLEPIGIVREVSREESMIEVRPAYREGLHGIAAGDRLDIHYWMHKLDPDQRKMLKVHPRGDKNRPVKGVFGLRSPMRPNPIGVSIVCVKRVEQGGLLVSTLDAKDGSPVIDIKASRTGSPLR